MLWEGDGMYVLERLVFQGTECCPQYRWIQIAVCGSCTPLDKVRSGQQQPGDWRIVSTPALMPSVIKPIQKIA